jgi:hypothetical protein
MSIAHVLTLSLTARGLSFPYSLTITSEGIDSRDVAVPIGGTPVEVAIAWVNARLKSVVIASTENVTLKTNSSSSPDTTIALIANQPLIWNISNYLTNPFAAADVTKLFFVNSGAEEADVAIEILVDATP